MTRQVIREWKRTLQRNTTSRDAEQFLLAQDSALNLLERSIRFGHGRLAVLRLIGALLAEAKPSADQWSYCCEAIQRIRDPGLQAMLEQAAIRAGCANELQRLEQAIA